MTEEKYHVVLEQLPSGNYSATLTGPGIGFADVIVESSRDEVMKSVEKRVAWYRSKPAPEEFDL